MTDTTKILPKLRFPEFKNDGEWKVVKLGEIAKRITLKNKDKKSLPVLTNSASGGIVKQEDYFDREIVSNDNLINYYIVSDDDFVYNPRISTIAPVGPISRNKIGKGVMSPLYTVFRFVEGNVDFFEHYFKTNNWHQYLKDKANFGARFDRMNITTEDFISLPIPFPSLPEQQKIASLLTSLDEQISANTKKLETLKAHKKSLMQQLFPANGEKTPKLRFPEFKNEREWEEDLIKNKCSIGTGKSNSQDQDTNGKYPFFIRSATPVKSNKYLYDCEAVITIGDGQIGKVFHYVNGKFDLHQRCYKMCDFKGIEGKFFFYFFSTHFYERAMRMTAKATVDSVRLEMISEMPISFPTLPEQQKIASFLTSIDEMIQTLDDKIRKLKTYKNGLMQQMFPQK